VRVEVRCCCDPSRILGTLDVEAFRVRNGQILRYPLFEEGQSQPRTIELEVGWLSDPDSTRLAVKSNEVPLDDLKKLRTFRPWA
jgi:hypothetical protein